MARLLGITRFWNYISDWIECRVHLRPEKDNALDLGSSDYQWRRVYVGSLISGINGTAAGTLTVYGPGASNAEGGQIDIYPGSTYQGVISKWSIDVYADDLRFFGTGGTVGLLLKAEGPVQLGHAGTALLPALTWTGDTDTGLWRSAADNLDFSTGGTNRLNIGSTGATVTGNVTSSGFFNFGSYSERTIASGAITVTGSLHHVDTEGDAASDDLETINGGSTGDILVLRSNNSARDVVLKNKTATGNLYLAGDFTLSTSVDTITLMCFGPHWYELSRSDNL